MEDCSTFENVLDLEIECNRTLSNYSAVSGLSEDILQPGIECNRTLSSCSTVDGLSADVLQVNRLFNTLMDIVHCM